MTDVILPQNWVLAPIADVLDRQGDGRLIHQGWSPQCERDPRSNADDWAALRTTSIQDGTFEPQHNKRLPDSLAPRPTLEVHAGDVLITCAGPRVRCGVACLVREAPPRLFISGKMYRMRARTDAMEARYLEAFLRSPPAQLTIDNMKTGSSESGMNLTHERFMALELPLPPLREQRRIVDKLDAIFARTRAARARLESIPPLLDQLRQSILAAAFRGDLTKDWREAHPDVEPASVLLERICVERRRRWEEGLRAKGKDPAKAKYEEPAAVDASELNELPEGWAWSSAGEVIDAIEAGRSPKTQGRPAGAREFGVLKVSAMSWGRFLPAENKALLPGDVPEPELCVRRGDLLFSRANTAELVGAVVLVHDDFPQLMLSDKSLRLVTVQGIEREFLLHAFRTSFVRKGFEEDATGTSDSMRNLSQDKIRAAPIPLSPLNEQRELAKVLRRAMATVDEVLARIRAEVLRIAVIEQSALAKAFRGELVPQDPNDEPASVLLERIRAERAAEPPTKRRRTTLKEDGEPETMRRSYAKLFTEKGRRVGPLVKPANGDATEGVPVEMLESALAQHGVLTSADAQALTGLDVGAVRPLLERLVELGLAKKTGQARGTKYVWRG